jgi:predicted nucleic acid-binding protein
MADSLIAGIVLEHAAIITRNPDNYRRVPGLKISGVYS